MNQLIDTYKLIAIAIFMPLSTTLEDPEETLVKTHFEEYLVVPELIPVHPKRRADVYYNDYKIALSEIYNSDYMQEPPIVKWIANPRKFYVLTMLDPDSPTAAARYDSAWKHWLVVNIPGNDISMGETLAEYQGPRPEPTTTHRYVILVYEQANPTTFYDFHIPKDSNEHRPKFLIPAYANKYKLGDPIAGMMFRSYHISDSMDIVPIIPTVQENDTTDAETSTDSTSELFKTKEVLETESTVFETESTVSVTESTVSVTENTVSETESTVSETEGTVSETEGTVLETNGTVSETESTVSETESTVSETESTVSETESTVSETESIVSETESIVSETNGTVSEPSTNTTLETNTQ